MDGQIGLGSLGPEPQPAAGPDDRSNPRTAEAIHLKVLAVIAGATVGVRRPCSTGPFPSSRRFGPQGCAVQGGAACRCPVAIAGTRRIIRLEGPDIPIVGSFEFCGQPTGPRDRVVKSVQNTVAARPATRPVVPHRTSGDSWHAPSTSAHRSHLSRGCSERKSRSPSRSTCEGSGTQATANPDIPRRICTGLPRHPVAVGVLRRQARDTEFDWAPTRLPRRPQPVPPVYQPEHGAAAVVYAADAHASASTGSADRRSAR